MSLDPALSRAFTRARLVMAKIAAYILAWLGSWTLAEVQQLAGIVSAFAVAIVAMLNGYLLWRDRIRQPRDGGAAHIPPRPMPPPAPPAPGDSSP